MKLLPRTIIVGPSPYPEPAENKKTHSNTANARTAVKNIIYGQKQPCELEYDIT